MTFRPDLIALDLDGTLLNSAKEVTARTAAALQAAAAAGIAVVLASGRMYHHCMEPLVTSLGLAGPVICYNGAVVLDAASGEILSELPVPADLVEPLVAFAAETDSTLNIYSGDVLYVRRETPWSRLYCGRTGAQPVFRDDLYTWFRGRPSTKLLLLDEPARIEELLPHWQQHYGDQLYITISDPEYLEFMNPAANKGWALRAVCERLGLDPARSAAFGDARNDLPLIQAAGYGVAMANGRPELQAVAAEVAPSHDDDGVAQVIERWLA